MSDEPESVLDFLRTCFNRLDERLDTIDRKLDEVVNRISALEYHFAGFGREMAAVNLRLDNLHRRVQSRVARRE
jgi:tetrahydromethanopterin S-methyltransferase subunit G